MNKTGNIGRYVLRLVAKMLEACKVDEIWNKIIQKYRIEKGE